jgi:transposase
MVQLTCRTGSDKLFGPTTLCLAQKRCERPRITHVFADGAAWIASVLKEKAPNAIRCTDPFHEVKWATEALDEVLGEVRRAAWNFARTVPVVPG